MASRTRITRTILSTLAVAAGLFASLQPATADASDPVLTAGLQAYAEEFGNSVGQIVSQNQAGATVILARWLRGYQIYTAGDPVSLSDTFAFCQQSAFGGLVSCEVVNPPGSTGYECDWDEQDSWCTCEGFYDCIDMFKTGPCTDGGYLSCGDGVCICEA